MPPTLFSFLEFNFCDYLFPALHCSMSSSLKWEVWGKGKVWSQLGIPPYQGTFAPLSSCPRFTQSLSSKELGSHYLQRIGISKERNSINSYQYSSGTCPSQNIVIMRVIVSKILSWKYQQLERCWNSCTSDWMIVDVCTSTYLPAVQPLWS